MSFSAPSSLARSLSHPLAVILTLPRPSFYPFFCSPSLMTNETAGAVSFVRVRASRTAQLSTTPFPNWLSNMRAAGRTRAGCRRGVGCVCGGGGAFKARRDCGERAPSPHLPQLTPPLSPLPLSIPCISTLPSITGWSEADPSLLSHPLSRHPELNAAPGPADSSREGPSDHGLFFQPQLHRGPSLAINFISLT
eukprot:181940-Rhodomonas_salina.1